MLPEISFVIPAYNEEEYISNVIKSIITLVRKLSYEIIVVDNGSKDNTKEVASKFDVNLISIPKSTISTARNIGAKKAQGPVLVFLDADVRITKGWVDEIENIHEYLRKEMVLTGSRCVVPENASLIEKIWFEPISRKSVSYVNGAHMVINRTAFSTIGGFDESLETGEDYEISQRAKKMGVRLEINKTLVVIHDGFPKTLKDFCRREVWHGKGDYRSLKNFFGSTVALASQLFGVLNLAVIVFFLHGNDTLAIIAIAAVFAMNVLMSVRIFSEFGMKYIFYNIPLCYFYLISRFLSPYLRG